MEEQVEVKMTSDDAEIQLAVEACNTIVVLRVYCTFVVREAKIERVEADLALSEQL